jgi:AMMECR1 domain-containing protein
MPDKTPELSISLMYDAARLEYLLRLARYELACFLGRKIERPHIQLFDWAPVHLNITLRREGRLCGSMSSDHADPPEAIAIAVRRAALDTRFGKPISLEQVDSTVIELWIEIQSASMGTNALSLESFRLGLDGVRITFGSRTAYYKPSVALTSGVASATELLKKLCRKAGLDQTAWVDANARIERTSWQHVVEYRGACVELSRLRAAHSAPVQRPDVVCRANLSLNRLLATQQEDGRFGYIYDPVKDLWSETSNNVRQAGCAYAVARAATYDTFAERQRIKQASILALRYLLATLTYDHRRGVLFVREPCGSRAIGKLGTTALTVLCAQYSSADPDTEARLVDSIIQLQRPDGSFICAIGDDEERSSSQNFYPGEALLALVVQGRRNTAYKSAAAIAKAFKYYFDHFHSSPSSAFILWQVDAWSQFVLAKLHKETPFCDLPDDPAPAAVIDFVFEQIDWLLRFQITSDEVKDYLGGFRVGDRPGFSTAAYVEALIRACHVAAQIGDEDRRLRYKQAALLGLRFLFRLQICDESRSFFPNPRFAIGGLTADFESLRMRCDFDQHFLTACLTALETNSLWT